MKSQFLGCWLLWCVLLYSLSVHTALMMFSGELTSLSLDFTMASYCCDPGFRRVIAYTADYRRRTANQIGARGRLSPSRQRVSSIVRDFLCTLEHIHQHCDSEATALWGYTNLTIIIIMSRYHDIMALYKSTITIVLTLSNGVLRCCLKLLF